METTSHKQKTLGKLLLALMRHPPTIKGEEATWVCFTRGRLSRNEKSYYQVRFSSNIGIPLEDKLCDTMNEVRQYLESQLGRIDTRIKVEVPGSS